MKRLAIYAHYGSSAAVAGHVYYCLEQVAALGFGICFVSNSEISAASEAALKKICERVLVRENTGLDFCMWQRGMAEYDLLQYEELLLTNSSIIGPVQALAPVWASPALAGCDFWGLTDNDELAEHLQSYFLVFRRRVLHSEAFREFWRSVLPYKNKAQLIWSYELGLTRWLQDAGFTPKPVFARKEIVAAYRRSRSLWQRIRDYYLYLNGRGWGRNTSVFFPELLLSRGMPFLKTALLRESPSRLKPSTAFAILEKSGLPPEILDEVRREFPAVAGVVKK
jgi:lipopolysaccharide biosynthesis protein